MSNEIINEIYIHSKSGRKYELLYECKHSETLEPMLVYKALYGDNAIWVRPKNMWDELVEVNGEMVPRFRPATIS
jgi:hypothetical protein